MEGVFTSYCEISGGLVECLAWIIGHLSCQRDFYSQGQNFLDETLLALLQNVLDHKAWLQTHFKEGIINTHCRHNLNKTHTENLTSCSYLMITVPGNLVSRLPVVRSP